MYENNFCLYAFEKCFLFLWLEKYKWNQLCSDFVTHKFGKNIKCWQFQELMGCSIRNSNNWVFTFLLQRRYIQSCQSVHMGNVSILVRAVNAGYLKKILAIYLSNHVTSEQSKCLSRGKKTGKLQYSYIKK